MRNKLFFITLALIGLSLGLSSCQKTPELTLKGSSNIELSADGGNATFTFTANRDWTVRSSDSWLIVSKSSGTATEGLITVSVSCAANTTYEDRTATVTIKMEDLSQTISVKQPANLGIILPTQSYDLQSDAKTIEVTVQANVEYTVSTSADWIKQTGTKALTSKILTFSIAENKTYDSREGKITIKPQQGNVQEQVITVRQAQKDAIKVEKTSYDMPYGGGQIEIKVEANVAFDVTPNVDWLHHTETKALSSSTVCIKVDENPTYSNREGKIEIAQRDGSIKHIITVKQAGRIAVSSVELSQTSLKMKEGEMVTLVATVKPDNATDKTVTWSSSNENIARVDQSGRVTAVKEGAATITAKTGEMSAKCAVTVYKDIPVTSIVLNKTSLSLVAGETTSLVATVKPDDATDKTVTWSSYDTSIATVNSEGKVTAVGKGSTTITASAGNYSSSCKVFVKAASYPTPYGATDLGLSVIWGEKNLGATSAYDAGGYYLWGDPTGTGIIAFFDTPNTNYICDTQYDIARIQLGKGWRLPTREEIKELLSSCSWETVSNGVRLTGPNGNSVILPLTGMAYPADGAVGSISISSKDKGYMMTGESYADSYGRFAYVYHYNQSFSYNWSSYNAPMAKFPVRPIYEMLEDYVPVSSVTLNITSLSLSEGESETLVATVKPDDATDKTVNWSSSNTAIVTVDANGKVTAVKEGTATITAKAGEKSATCTVTVSKKVIAVTSISLNKTSLALKEGESETLVATVKPDDATDKTVNWSSSNTAIVTVDANGKVTAVKEGSAVITAKAGEKSASCSVTVRSNNGSVPDGAVDLGLSVLWATKGLGASKTEEEGTLYAWGESRTKSYFGWDSYAFYDWNFATLYRGLRCSKYNDSDKKRKLDRNDDAASVNLGGKWRMPTEAELSELFSGCHWERVHLDVGLGLAALKGTSNKTGETIIIPVWQIQGAAFTVKLWSSELSPEQNSKLANTFEFYVNKDGSEGSQTDVYEERYKGFYIRPVYDPSMDDFVAVSNIALDKTELTLKVGATATLGATIMPDNATDKTILWETFDERTATVDKNGKVTAWEHGTVTIRAYICGKNARCEVTVLDKDEPELPADDIPVESISLNKSEVKLIEGESEMLIASVKPDNATNKTVKWSSSAPDIATVDSEGKVKAIKKGSATITASAVGGVKSATCLVTVEKKVEIPTAIDLGLSIKWGSFNLGASKPEEYGEYFAWGETKAKDSYTWETYTLSNGTKSTLTKYNSKQSSGTVDNKVILEANDDAAHVLLGGTWRMPSVEELQELITQCSWEWTSKNGTAGYLVKSKVNGNSIFLPAAGNYDGASLYSAGSRCLYWTSSLFDDAPAAAMCGRFYVSGGNNKIETSYLLRCYGFAVRPVTE